MTAKIDDASTYPYAQCPFCGGKEFYVKQHASGPIYYCFNGDGTEADNTEMYRSVDVVYSSKYCYCSRCKKRLFEVE